jgi:hypothetical protein
MQAQVIIFGSVILWLHFCIILIFPHFDDSSPVFFTHQDTSKHPICWEVGTYTVVHGLDRWCKHHRCQQSPNRHSHLQESCPTFDVLLGCFGRFPVLALWCKAYIMYIILQLTSSRVCCLWIYCRSKFTFWNMNSTQGQIDSQRNTDPFVTPVTNCSECHTVMDGLRVFTGLTPKNRHMWGSIAQTVSFAVISVGYLLTEWLVL